MGETHIYCRKEKEIAEIHTDLSNIKEIVMGKEGLHVSVPKLTQSVDTLAITVSNLDRNVDKVQQKLDRDDGHRQGKAEIRRRNQWLIGICKMIF